jgi:predicted aspartyl protease
MFKIRQAAAAVLSCAAMAAPSFAMADCKLLQLAEFKLDPNSYAPIVEGSINSHPVKILIDSGAAFSGVVGSAADRLGLPTVEMAGMRAYGIGGDTQVYRAHIDRLKIDNLEKAGLDLYVVGDANETQPYSMVLGDDVLSKVDVEFDLAHNAIRLFQPKGCTSPQLIYWGAAYSQAQLLGVAPNDPAIQARALVNGKQVLAELDSGADSSVLDATTAAAVGVARPATATDDRAMHGVGPRTLQSWTGQLNSFALGDEQIAHVNLQIVAFSGGMSVTDTGSHTPHRIESTPSMFIGDDFLHAHRVFVDNEDHLLLFSYQGGPVFKSAAPPRTQAAK